MATHPYADGCAFIEGKFFPIAEARIPILDTGFTRSDLTYDVVAVWKGKFFRLDDHLERFENSYTQLRMKPTISLAEMRQILFECFCLLPGYFTDTRTGRAEGYHPPNHDRSCGGTGYPAPAGYVRRRSIDDS
jgi:hypothetical protein